MNGGRPALAALAIATLLTATIGCTAIPFFVPTSTPTPTPTHTPTATPTAIPTSPPTAAPKPTPGSAGRTEPDGSTPFTDSELGYQLTLPPEWIVINLGAEDIEAALQQAGEANPDLAPLIDAYAATVAQGARLVAFDPDPGQLATGYMGNIVVVAVDFPGVDVSLENVVESTAQYLEAMIPGSELLSSEMIDDLNGHPVGRIEMRMHLTTLYGTPITVRSTWIIALVSGKLFELTLQSEASRFPGYAAMFEDVIQSLVITPP
jgi:hypothetical protein